MPGYLYKSGFTRASGDVKPMGLSETRAFLRTALDGGSPPLTLSFNRNPGHFASYPVNGQGHEAPGWLLLGVQSRLRATAAAAGATVESLPVPRTRTQRLRS